MALDLLGNDAAILSGIENMTGEAYAMGIHGATKLQQVFSDAILMRRTYAGGNQNRVILGQSGTQKSYELWGQFTGGIHNRGNVGRYSGYELNNYGVIVGAEKKLSRRWFGGVALAYDNASVDLDDRYAQDDFDAFRVSLYGGYAGKNWYGSGYAGYAKNWHDVTRNNPVLGFRNTGKYDDNVFSNGVEFGRVARLYGGTQFIPSVGLHWIHLNSPSLMESGNAISALAVSKGSYDSVRLPIGARLNRTHYGERIAVTPEVRAFYIAELADESAGVTTAFASSLGSGSVFADSGSGGHNGANFGTGVTATIRNSFTLGVDYDYEIWENYDRHNLVGSMTYRW